MRVSRVLTIANSAATKKALARISMAAKKKEIRTSAPAAPVAAHQQILSLYVPAKTKKTQLIEGTPAEAAKALVARLRDDARVI